MDIFHVTSGVKRILAKSAHMARKKQATVCPISKLTNCANTNYTGEGIFTELYFSQKTATASNNTNFQTNSKSKLLLKSAPNIQESG